MTLEEYKKELEYIEKQYGGEEALYPLINIFLRELGDFKPLNKQDPSLVDVHRGRLCKYASRNLLYGISNFPDMVIMGKDFAYKDNQLNYKKDLIDEKSKLFGCIEVKDLSEKLDEIMDNTKKITLKYCNEKSMFCYKEDDQNYTEVNQLYGDVLWYGKVIHTNGKIWNYYEIENKTLKDVNEFLMNYYFQFMKTRCNNNAQIVKDFYETVQGFSNNLDNEKDNEKEVIITMKTIANLDSLDSNKVECEWNNLITFFKKIQWANSKPK